MNAERIRHIDGLRAFAVAAVLLFHFFPVLLPNGYIGVDIFFVISGFVVTRVIAPKIKDGTFTFLGFYQKRAIRLLPAAYAMLLVSSALCYFILLAPDLLRYAESLLASLTLVPNIYFWRTGGYFGTNDGLKPLLHMWSLGVEEQFYLIFPLALYLLLSATKKSGWHHLALAAVTTLGFAGTCVLVAAGGGTPAFFLLPTRIWQLSLGAVLALRARSDPYSSQLIPTIGLALIAANLGYQPDAMPTGSLAVLGVAVLIYRDPPTHSPVGWLLTNRGALLVGALSYSLYLWHWPLVALTRYFVITDPPAFAMLAALFLTFLLAYLSRVFVERPFMASGRPQLALLILGVIFLLLLSASLLIFRFHGFPHRYSAKANALAEAVGTNYRCSPTEFIPYGASRACIVGPNRRKDYDVALLGNSHAQMYGPAFIGALDKYHREGLIVPLNSCLPTLDINVSLDCLHKAEQNALALVADKKVTTVIVAQTWENTELVTKDGATVKDPDFSRRIESLASLRMYFARAGKTTYLIGPIEIPHIDYASIASRTVAFWPTRRIPAGIPRGVFDAHFAAPVAGLSKIFGGYFLLPSNFLCDPVLCRFADDHGSLFADSSHLSASGAKLMEPMFLAILAPQ